MKTLVFCSFFFLQTLFAVQTLHIVRGNGEYPPFEMLDENEKLIGIHIECVQAISKKLNIKVRFESLPWQRALMKVRNKQADAITYVGKTAERETFLWFLKGNTLSYSTNSFFALKENNVVYTGNLQELQNYSIGTIRGFSYGEAFNKAHFLKKNNATKNINQLVDKLLNKRVELIIANKERLLYFAKEHKFLGAIQPLKPSFKPIAQYIAFSKQEELLVLAQRFEKAMEAFKKSSEYEALFKKYGLLPYLY